MLIKSQLLNINDNSDVYFVYMKSDSLGFCCWLTVSEGVEADGRRSSPGAEHTALI